MDEREYEMISEKVAEKVVSRFLLLMGINSQDPEELVKFQKDFAHLRGWREGFDLIKKRGLAATVGFMITASLGYVLFFFSKH